MHLKISGPLACGPEIEVSVGNSTHCVENELGLANFLVRARMQHFLLRLPQSGVGHFECRSRASQLQVNQER